MNPIVYAIPFFLITLCIEAYVTRNRDDIVGYEMRDTWTSLAMGVGNVGVGFGAKIVGYGFWVWLYQFRVFDLSDAWWVWALCFLGEDACYYAFHRAGHEIRFFWAAHENHHSSQHYNLSTALRQSWTTPLTGPIFWAPLPLLGFDPNMVVMFSAFSLLYQYWIHTELIDRMGPLEGFLNTPSQHRVHHGRNVEYLDRNYAGVLMIWDRMFGSFELERNPVDYGMTKNIDTFNPVRVAFHEWASLIRDVAASQTLGEALGRAFGPPGWSPDGSTQTAGQMRRAQSQADAGLAGAR